MLTRLSIYIKRKFKKKIVVLNAMKKIIYSRMITHYVKRKKLLQKKSWNVIFENENKI